MLQKYAITIGVAAQIMNEFLENSPDGLITDIVLEAETESINIRFQHERGKDFVFHIHPEVFDMANAEEFADMLLKAAYNIDLATGGINPTLN